MEVGEECFSFRLGEMVWPLYTFLAMEAEMGFSGVGLSVSSPLCRVDIG